MKARYDPYDDYRARKVLDLDCWDRVVEMARVLDVAHTVIYIYQMEWRRVPFYVGLTNSPWERLSAHMTTLWRRALPWAEPAPSDPRTFRRVVEAARERQAPQMRIIDAYHRHRRPWLCEAGWIARRRAEGYILLNEAIGERACVTPRACGCWEQSAEKMEQKTMVAQHALASLEMRPAPERTRLESDIHARWMSLVGDWDKESRATMAQQVVTRERVFAHLCHVYSNHKQIMDELHRKNRSVRALSPVEEVRRVLDGAIEQYYAAQLRDVEQSR